MLRANREIERETDRGDREREREGEAEREKERDLGANHISPLNYNKASLITPQTRRRTVSP